MKIDRRACPKLAEISYGGVSIKKSKQLKQYNRLKGASIFKKMEQCNKKMSIYLMHLGGER